MAFVSSTFPADAFAALVESAKVGDEAIRDAPGLVSEDTGTGMKLLVDAADVTKVEVTIKFAVIESKE